jgi:hypothetical protein
MTNVLHLAALADYIASYFSSDAATWPDVPRAGAPLAIAWTPGDPSGRVRSVVEALRKRTEAPYRSTDNTRAVPIVNADAGEPAVAVITFWSEERPDDGPGLRYELSFQGSSGTWPGWFALEAA